MTTRLLDAGADAMRERGYDVSYPDSGAEPPAVAVPGDGADAPFGDPVETALDPLADADPTTVLSRLWTNRNHDRATLFVVDDRATADAVADLLAPPLGVVSADEQGRRVFFDGPDRVPLAEGGYAAVPAGDAVEWRESGEGETFRLELRADDGTVLGALDGVGALDCPPRATFPYGYERDADKRIRVFDFRGRPVETFPGVKAMRAGGFAPVAAPLVPEHMLDGDVDGWWGCSSPPTAPSSPPRPTPPSGEGGGRGRGPPRAPAGGYRSSQGSSHSSRFERKRAPQSAHSTCPSPAAVRTRWPPTANGRATTRGRIRPGICRSLCSDRSARSRIVWTSCSLHRSDASAVSQSSTSVQPVTSTGDGVSVSPTTTTNRTPSRTTANRQPSVEFQRSWPFLMASPATGRVM
ncbi:hypothetical protein [Halobaculum litoreum]|uniref:hypothetical protein n=1 Tax=Halobaculum litoreum TaxID=3031998 RepID=UPI0031F30B64